MDQYGATLIYKCVCIVSGIVSIFFGYRLFVLGIVDKDGDFKASGRGFQIGLAKASPGIFFSLFGAAIIIATIAQGYTIGTKVRSANSPDNSVLTAPTPPLPALTSEQVVAASRDSSILTPVEINASNVKWLQAQIDRLRTQMG